MFIHYHMTPTPTTMHPEQTVAEAIELLACFPFRHIPLVDDEGVLQGIVSDRDLRSAKPSSVAQSSQRAMVESKVMQTRLSQIMSTNCRTLSAMATVDDALFLFEANAIGALPILDDERRLIGIFTIGDLLKAYKTMFGVGERGAAMISIVDDGDPRIMSKLIGIMEEKNVHCTRLLRKSATRRTKAMIYLRVNTYNTRAVQKAIEAAGYEIHVPYSAV
ncbi:MAG: CBS domain-containing protein [Desulfobulbaceae bacterium]|nr:CBS domain-containing protein [Desulfobulbaceae bacterium]